MNEYEVFLNIVGIENKVAVKVYASDKDEAYDVAVEIVSMIKSGECECDAVNITRRNIKE